MRSHAPDRSQARRDPFTPLFVGLVALWMCGAAYAQQGWEMRVCAEPYNFPASSRDDGGFNNRIAEILADELGAHVTYEWTIFTDETIELTLMAGDCDLAIGIAESAAGTLNTVPYLRAPYVFVSRADRNIDVASLDDPALGTLRIGTYPTGIPSIALQNRGIADNVTELSPIGSPGGLDRDTPILDAVVAGEVDIGIVYGPPASARAAVSDAELRVVPVTPEIDVGGTLLQLFRIWTIAVRPHDESFRDRLNLALAARWEEIQEAIAAFGVDRLSVTRPPVQTDEPPSGVGLVAPTDASGRIELGEIGMAALHGADLAESFAARETPDAGIGFRVLHASAPTDAAAVRAAERLAVTENVFALIGGFGRAQAERIGEIAAASELLFFNIATIDDDLRSACRATTFHVAASESMYADAAVDWLVGAGASRVFFVHVRGTDGDALAERVAARISDAGGEAVGAAAVDAEQFVFVDPISAAREAGADAVLLALPLRAQELFLSQLPAEASTMAVTGLPYSLGQTRASLIRLRDANPDVGATPRVVVWDASLDAGRAAELNDQYVSRAGAVMDATAWAAFAAVTIARQTASDADTGSVEALIEYLERPETTFEVGKGFPLSFRPWDHQARQQLYVARLREGAQWSNSVRDRMGLAEVVAVAPERSGAETADLDRFGVGPNETACVY